MVNKVVKKQEQKDYHISLDEGLNHRFIKYMRVEFRKNSRVVTAIVKKALDDYLAKKGY